MCGHENEKYLISGSFLTALMDLNLLTRLTKATLYRLSQGSIFNTLIYYIVNYQKCQEEILNLPVQLLFVLYRKVFCL